MHHTSLIFGLRVHRSHSLQYTHTLVSHDKLDALQTSPFEPPKKAAPAGLVLFHFLGSPQHLAVAVLIDRNGNQYAHILIFSAPVAAHVDGVHIGLSCSAR